MADDSDDDDVQAGKNQNMRTRAVASQLATDQRDSKQGYQSMLARTPAAKQRRKNLRDMYKSSADDE